MDPTLQNYITKLISSDSKIISIKIPMVYNFSMYEISSYIKELIPTKTFNITNNGINQTRNNLTYDFVIEISN